jgi:hypothetical protein
MMRKQAQNVAIALISIASYIQRVALRERIESAAIAMIEHVYGLSVKNASSSLDSLEGLVELGESIYEIEPTNSSLIREEIRSLSAAIRQSHKIPMLKTEDLEKILKTDPNENDESRGIFRKNGPLDKPVNKTFEQSTNQDDVFDPAIRQSRIIATIENASNKVHLKDILSVLPEVSERTVRYDIQKLIKTGLIKRVGGSGPSTHYVIK